MLSSAPSASLEAAAHKVATGGAHGRLVHAWVHRLVHARLRHLHLLWHLAHLGSAHALHAALVVAALLSTHLSVLSAVGSVHPELSSVEVVAVHLLNDSVKDLRVSKLDKAKALAAAGLLIGNNLDRVDVAKVGKGVADLLLGGAPGDVADVDRLGGVLLLLLVLLAAVEVLVGLVLLHHF